MDAFAELLQSLGPGHWLMVAGSVLIVLGALGLLIRRSRQTGPEVEDVRTPAAEPAAAPAPPSPDKQEGEIGLKAKR